ncbi:MAG: tetratricopeptide repeat protein [Candidatus Cloacimonetes bacterium]|nr:tetratricopeptide repeat protein [Candidatus Cloacimonadota bacterium]
MSFKEHYNRGVDLWQDGKYVQAIQSFKEAQKLQPNDIELKQMISQMEMQAAQILENEKRFKESCAREAESRREVMGQMYGVTDEQRVVSEYPQKLSNNPNDKNLKGCLSVAHYILGLTFESKDDHDRAEKDYGWAIHYEPDFPLAVKNRGRVRLKIRQYNGAIEDFEFLLKLDPNSDNAKNAVASAYFERAIDHDKKGNSKHAIDDLEMVLKYNPNNNNARELLKMIRDKK